MRCLLILLLTFCFISCGSDSKDKDDSDSIAADNDISDELTDSSPDNDDMTDENLLAEEDTEPDEDVSEAPVATDFVLLKTNMGNITIGLYENELPVTTANFKQYVTDKFYDGLIFHRIVPDFVIQGGGYDKDLVEKAPRDSIQFESHPLVRHVKYAVSMARGQSPNSATSQFFITLDAFPHLDYNSDDDYFDEEKFPCAVFGIVTEGFEIVDKISAVQTETVGMFEGVPAEPVIIESAALIN